MEYGIFLLIVVALIWGLTNPLMKKGSEGIEKCSSSGGMIASFLQEVKFLLLNWKYLTAFGLNQCGSFLYYYALGQCEMMIAGPLTNTLTFLVTYLSGKFLFGEEDDDDSLMKKIGLACVCSGVTLCVYDKLISSA